MNKFSKQEKIDLSISIIVLTLIISFMYSRPNITVDKLLLFIPIAFVTVGLGFVLHELGHKFVAQKYGFYAEFRRSDKGLMLGIVTALMGFLFFAPGAVMIGSPTGIISEEENGKISIAGPIVNIILALIFLGIQISIQPLVTLSNIDMMVYLYFLSVIGFNINSFLALFNLLPIPPLDGSKVISWNLPIWLISIVISGLLTLSAYIH
ncbi:site-2 protease family protein [Methanosphaera sp. BMS]|uniref:site-2 protease family protein n=1 Tax=Methanosphaera sp. BMS TaxID=1789762 RepID=UPI000DC1EF56|nr:site-2 protease family protein [Methanosphaera sp. BMS]AWX33406.1 metalloprotease [Methanosphaera sp. BMS]